MNIVLLGGNGYIGSVTTELWMKQMPSAHFYVISGTGINKLQSKNITNLSADVSDYESVRKILPDTVDYIVDFVGRPEKNKEESINVNNRPAEVMKQIAEENNAKAMGFIGGTLGPKHFINTKQEIIHSLSKSNIKFGYVEPTLVYGRDRNDGLSKMVPLFKFLGIFSKKLQPIHIEVVAKELLYNILN